MIWEEIKQYHLKILLRNFLLRIYHSPLQRATQTACIVAQDIALPLLAADKLKEWHFGDWEGKPSINLPKYFLTLNPPNGESHHELIARVKEVTNHILRESTLPLIVAHGGTYLALCHLMNLNPEPIENCQLLHFTPPNETYNGWECYYL